MSLMELGIAAARAGNRTEARMFLEAATLEDPTDAQALLWLSFVLDDRKLAMRCLERVLDIDPSNEQAKRGLAWLRSQEKGALLPQRLSDAEIKPLLQALGHADEQIVVRAIRRLGESGDTRAVEPLLTLLVTTKRKLIQGQARTALIAIGTQSVEPVLRRLLAETNPELASQLAAVLARIRSMPALAACREVVEQAKHPGARYAMVLNLAASVHGEAALGIIRDYLADTRQDERARATILMSIGQSIKGKALDPQLGLKFLMDIRGDQYLPSTLRQAALVALGISSQQQVVRYILEAMADKDAQIRVAAVDALARFTPPQVQLLDKLARSPDQTVRTRANLILNQFQSAQKR